MLPFQTFLYAILGGIVPALLWLYFWLKEDKKNPEPKRLLLFAFVAGMIAVLIAIPFEKYANTYFTGILLIILWSAIEEILKFAGAYFSVLKKKAVDEPIDIIIYMITVALGFAALENTLFLINLLIDGNITNTIINGNLRFLGATLLHTLSSATVGIMIAFSFYRGETLKKIYTFLGLILAIVLHTLFNFFIIKESGEKILTIFFFVWIGIVILILLFEKIKRIKNPIFYK